MLISATRRFRGFTLLEMTVVAVILTIVAIITYPSLRNIIESSDSGVTKSTLAQIARNAQSQAISDRLDVPTTAQLQAAVGDQDAGWSTVESPTVATDTNVSVYSNGDRVGLAVLDPAGKCVLVLVEGVSRVVTRVESDVLTCNGELVLLGKITEAPTISSTIEGSGLVVVLFTPPAGDVDGYEYSLDNGTTWLLAPTSSSPMTIDGLTNGTTYQLRLRATNAYGAGPASYPYTVTPRTVADPPTGVTAQAGVESALVSWSAPMTSGGSQLSGYTVNAYNSSGGPATGVTGTSARSVAAGVTTYSFTGLQAGATYRFKVTALTDLGPSDPSALSGAVTPVVRPPAATVPAAPAAPTATAGDAQVTLSWSAPNDGGSAITDYQIQLSTNDGTTWTSAPDAVSASASATVSTLQNGTAYVFRVAAVNSEGTGSYSPKSSAVTPITTPSQVTGVAVTPGNTTLAVTWTALSATAARPVSGYRVYHTTGSTQTLGCTANDPASTGCTIPSLQNGTSYQVTVKAYSPAGEGVASSPVSGTPRTTPGAPGTPSASRGNGSVTLTWTSPADTGGSPVTDYQVQYSSNSGANWTTYSDTVSTSTTLSVSGLTNGTTYVFRVAAINVAGTGTSSSSSNAVKFAQVPAAVTTVSSTIASGEVTLTWTAPSTNGEPITDYQVQYSTALAMTSPTAVSDSVSSSSTLTVSGLANGTTYYFQIRALNALGWGEWGPSPAHSKKPYTTPGVPTSVTGTGSNASVTLNWIAPVSNGGSAITGYKTRYSTNGTAWSAAAATDSATTTVTVSGLTNGTGYYFQVAATNAAGDSSWSASSALITPYTTPGTPGTPTLSSATNTTLSMTFAAPGSNGGSSITAYVVQRSLNNSTWTAIDSNLATTSFTDASLTRNTTYYYRVAAVNAAGQGSYSAVGSAVTLSDAVTVTTSTWTTSSITWTWTSTGATNYGVYLDNVNMGIKTGTSITYTGFSMGTTHTLKVYPYNSAGTANSFGTKSQTTLSLNGGVPIGSLDSVSPTSGANAPMSASGWAIDPDSWRSISVHVYISSGPPYGPSGTWGPFITTANVSRTDVGDTYPGYGDNHGFSITGMTGGGLGGYAICAYAIDTYGTGLSNQLLGCKSAYGY